jgi:putative ABC transport system permease protein
MMKRDGRRCRNCASRRRSPIASVRCARLAPRRRSRPARLADSWLADIWQDLRYAARTLRRQRGFTAAAVLTLALGIGANGAIFALVDATLLRPLPFPEPDRLAMLWERTDAAPRGNVSPLNLTDWTDRSRTFETIGGFVPNVGGMVMAGADGNAETVPRQWVTAGIFEALGVPAIAGRTFQASDDGGGKRLVVLNETFWHSRFNRDPSVIGREVRLDGDPHTIVGVVPEKAQVIGRSSIWALRPIRGAPPSARTMYAFRAIGRLKPGVSPEQARADLGAVADGLAREYPQTNSGRGVTLEPLQPAVVGSDLRQTSMLFLGVVGFVLLICCANVANLLLTRATVRRRELAVRAALGADRLRVVRQLLTESILLATLGGILGLAVGAVILRAAPLMIPPALLPAAVTLSFDARVVAFCAVTVLVVGLLFGLVPAWQATQPASASALTADGRTMTRRGGWIRTALAAAQVATAVILLAGAGLLLRTLVALQNVDRGYRADSVLTMVVDPIGSRYPTPIALLRFFDEVEQEIAALPGVQDVAWASTLPLGRSYAGQSAFQIVGQPPSEDSQRPTADYQIVSPAYFRALDLPIVAGRGFTAADRVDSVPVCLVNEAFVRRYLQGRDAIGARVSFLPSDPPEVREIVGVVRQVKGRLDETEDLLQIYVPMAQQPLDDMFLLVRPASGSANALASGVRAAIGRVDTEQLVSVRSVMTLDDVAWDATARYRFRAVLVITFAALALALAMVGVFGVLAYSVEQRVRDFGIRRALGATAGDVLRLVVLSAGWVVAVGAAIGVAGAIALGRLIDAMLFGVPPVDPVTFAAVAVVLVLTATLAIAGPAWRAARVDPVVALRAE